MNFIKWTATAALLAGVSFIIPIEAGEQMDVVTYFAKARSEGRDGLARKTQLVDARAAKPGEIITTIIKGEGKETQSKLAEPGDQVVRNRCTETGSEQYLVAAEKFAARYEGPTGPGDINGWRPFRPRGKEMRFVRVRDMDGTFTFTAPWGEKMIAHPGDVIVQDPMSEKDTYRVQKVSFNCTYEVITQPKKE